MADVSRFVTPAKLLESPVTALRRQHGLTPDTAAAILGISVLQLARLEAATRRISPRTLAAIRSCIVPAARYQPSFFDEVD